MSQQDTFSRALFHGLQALADAAFPKKCPACGRVYHTVEEFIARTKAAGHPTGLRQAYDDDDRPIVELYRNCVCGSTLMDFFGDRRDTSPAGLRRRQRFGELMDFLVANGVAPEAARAELLKVMRGERSELLEKHRPPSVLG